MIDSLLARLERDADVEIAGMLDGARARAVAIAAAADQRIAARRATILGRRESEARAQLERVLAAARRAARAKALTARAELLDRFFAAVRAELPALEQAAPYRARAAPQLHQLLGFAGDQAVTVRCSRGLTPALRGAVKTNGRLRIEPDPSIIAGFRLTTTDGGLEIDATLERRLERLRPRLALAALAELSS